MTHCLAKKKKSFTLINIHRKCNFSVSLGFQCEKDDETKSGGVLKRMLCFIFSHEDQFIGRDECFSGWQHICLMMSPWCHRGLQTFKRSPHSVSLARDFKFKRRLTWRRGCHEGAPLSCIVGSVGSSRSRSLSPKNENGIYRLLLPLRNLKEMFNPKILNAVSDKKGGNNVFSDQLRISLFLVPCQVPCCFSCFVKLRKCFCGLRYSPPTFHLQRDEDTIAWFNFRATLSLPRCPHVQKEPSRTPHGGQN